MEIEGKELSPLMIGSSPFCGSRQFGHKAPAYFERFFNHPDNITKLLVYFYNKGYKGAHLLAYPPIAGAGLKAYHMVGENFPVIITLMPGDEKIQWQWIRRLNTVAVFLHAFETDKINIKALKEFCRICGHNGVIPGVSTHNPGITIPRLDQEMEEIKVYLAPLNPTGIHVHPSLESAVKAIRETPRRIIGMKILSCGEVPPPTAFPFALPLVDGVTVGMTEEWEIDENCLCFEENANLLGRDRNRR